MDSCDSERTPAGRLLVSRVQRFCLHDGPGIRTTVFTQGCSLRCWWCQNPDTIPQASAAARLVEVEALVEECCRDARYWRESGGGVTVSGGEPLLQAEALAAFLRRMRRDGHHRAVETGGAAAPRQLAAVAPHVDLWLWDLKAVSPDHFREHTGGDAYQCLDNLRRLLAETAAEVVLRVPLIHGFNADTDELGRMARRIEGLPRAAAVEILPGHAVGCASVPGRPSPRVGDDEVALAERIFRAHVSDVLVRW